MGNVCFIPLKMETKPEPLKNHNVKEIDALGLSCSVHPQEDVIAFCDTCQKAVCFDCSRGEHKDHSCFKMDSRAVESRTKIPKLCNIIQHKKLPELNNCLEKIQSNKLELLKSDEVSEKIHKRANELMALVMEERDLLLEQCKNSRLSQEKYFQIEENVIRRYIDLYKISVQESSDVMTSSNDIELVMFESKLNSQLRDFKPKSLRSGSLPKFKPGKNDKAGVKSMIGSLLCDSNFADITPNHDEIIGIQTKLVSSIRYSCLNIGSFSFQENDMAWVNPVESTVAAVIDGKGTEHKKFDLGVDISDMTVTDRNIILATDTVNKRIVRITNNGVVRQVLNTSPLQPHGICGCRNGDLLISQMFKTDPKSANSKRLIHRLDRDYKIKLTIQFTDSFFNKKHILTHPRRVRENFNGDIIVVDLLGETSGRVVAFDFVGKLRFTYDGNPNRSKFLPFDICCEPANRIFVSDYYNHEINLLNCDGQFIQEIQTSLEGLLNPLSINLDRKGKLWIGGKGGKIIIYKYT